DHAGDHRLLVDVHSAASLIDHVHGQLLPCCRSAERGCPCLQNLLCVLPWREQHSVVPGASQDKLSADSQHQAKPTFVDSATPQPKSPTSPFHHSVVTAR